MKPSLIYAKQIAALNELCFDKADEYSDARRVMGCHAYVIFEDTKLVAYVLIRPGRIATLDRYGVRPGYQGRGHGVTILKRALVNFRAVTTYVLSSNATSCAALLKAGFFVTGTDNGSITLMYLREDVLSPRSI